MADIETLDWIKRIDDALLQLDEKPQFNLPSTVPLKEISELLEKLFKRQNVRIEHQGKGWQKGAALFSGLGDTLSVLAIEWTPLDVPIFFVLSQQDLRELVGDLLGGEEAATPFFDASLASGILHYLTIEVVQKLEASRFLYPLSPRVGHAPLDIRAELSRTHCFVSDVSLFLGKKTIWGRVLVPEEFREKLKAQMSNFSHVEMSEDQGEKIMVDLALQVGRGILSIDEWKSVKIGDFVLLDHCSYNPHEQKGSVILKLGDTPVFRGRLKQGSIKISEYPLYEEVEMGDQFTNSDQESDFLKEDSAKNDVDSLPLHLSVEVGRIRMSIKELRALSPGNLLDLGVAPEQGVDILVNGRKMGRGELIRMGETVGIRILSL